MSGTLNSALEEISAALRTNASAEAMNASAELLSAYPLSVRAWRARAVALEADGQFSQAAEAFGRVLDIVPSDAAALVAYARNLFAAGRGDEADDAARQALDYDPDNAILRRYAHDGRGPAHIGTSGRVQFARNQFHAGLANRAIAKLRGILEGQPTRVDVHVELADMLHRNSIRFTSAEICRHVLTSHPNCLIANAILAVHNQRVGNPDVAQRHLSVVAQIDPDGRETVALLGSRSPVRISDALVGASVGAIAGEDDESRSDWVDQLIASTSTPPAPVSSKAGPGVIDPDTDENELLGKDLTTGAQNMVAGVDGVDEYESTINFELPPLDWSSVDASSSEVTRIDSAPRVDAGADNARIESRQRVTDEGVTVEPLDWAHVESTATTDTPADAAETPTDARPDDADASDDIDIDDGEPEFAIDTPIAHGDADIDDEEALDHASSEVDDEAALAPGDAENDADAGEDLDRSGSTNDSGIVFGRTSRRPLPSERGSAPAPEFIEHGARMIRVDTMKPESTASRSGVRGKPADLLSSARTAIDQNAFDEATAAYKQLVAKGRLLDDVIGDLQRAIAAHPGVIALHEALGIALTRKGEIPAAMAAFREAQRIARG